MSDSKNNIAWEKIFLKHKILQSISETGSAVISSNEINEFREARLMTKFDHRSQLPKIFAENNLSILPISRGGYIIGSFEIFHDLNQNDSKIRKIEFPPFIESLDYKDITSESTAINCAFVSGILNDFIGEDSLHPTVNGRMSSSSFTFKIDSSGGSSRIEVNNSQVEIDGGFESDNSLTLIEAKNYLSDDFLIRQLYYPYRLWKSKIRKNVRLIFMTYSNGIFDLREYLFEDTEHYNSLRLIKQQNYAVYDSTINIETIQRILDETQVFIEPQIPFPQADSFERVINLCELLKQKEVMTKEEITENYDFEGRQTDYYMNAGKYLGLIENGKENNLRVCYLTGSGQKLFSTSIVDRQTEFIKLILSFPVFNRTLALYFNQGTIPSKENIVEIMKQCGLYNVESESTYFRRASTVSGWINWILNQVEE